MMTISRTVGTSFITLKNLDERSFLSKLKFLRQLNKSYFDELISLRKKLVINSKSILENCHLQTGKKYFLNKILEIIE